MREAVKNYGLLQGEAKRLKEWLEKEFEESKKYESFVESLKNKIDLDQLDLTDLDEFFEE